MDVSNEITVECRNMEKNIGLVRGYIDNEYACKWNGRTCIVRVFGSVKCGMMIPLLRAKPATQGRGNGNV